MLARVAREQGFENVGVLYRNDPYGLGLFESFRDAWTGAINAVAVEGGQASYLPELRRSAEGGASALVLLTFESEGAVILREAIDSGLYTRFAFGDAVKSPDLVQGIGGRPAGRHVRHRRRIRPRQPLRRLVGRGLRRRVRRAARLRLHEGDL